MYNLLSFLKRYKSCLSLFGLLLLVYFVFSPSLQNSFTNWDDPEYLLENKDVQGLSFENAGRIFTSHLSGKYNPLVLASFMLEHHFFGLDPKIYHYNNLALHMVNTMLVVLLVYLLIGRLDIAFTVALLFGVHPLNVEPVAWVSARKDVLFGLFYLCSLICYVKYLKRGLCRKYIVMSFLFFALSLFSKAMALSLPFVMLLVDNYINNKIQPQDILKKWLFFLLSFAFGLITLVIINDSDALPGSAVYSGFERVLLAIFSTFHYLASTLFPVTVSSFYPFPHKYGDVFQPVMYLLPLAVVPILVLMRHLYVRNRFLIAPMLFFLITIFPVIHLIKVNDSVIYNRFMYIPALGIFLLMAFGYDSIKKCAPKAGKVVAKALFVVYIMYLCVFSAQYCLVWRNSGTLWSDVISKFKHAAVAHQNRGAYFLSEGQYRLAMIDFEEALYWVPRYADAHYNKGLVFSKFKQYDLAMQAYDKAIESDPSYIKAYNNRGNLKFALGMLDEAIKDYSYAVSIDSEYVLAYANRSAAYLAQGNHRLAKMDVVTVLDADPNNRTALEIQKQLYNNQD